MSDPHEPAAPKRNPPPKRTRRTQARAATQPHKVERAAAGYAPAVNAGVQATVQTVQDMHHAIADKTFDGLLRVPGLSVPTRIVQGVHDAVTQGVYAAVRQGSGALMSLAGAAEQLATDATIPPQGRELAVRSALNGVFGDALAQAGSSLAVRMGFHQDGSPLPLTAQALARLRARVCVFIHGLACDEQSWRRPSAAWQGTAWEHALAPGEAVHYGALLAKESQDISCLYLRYNTGLPIADNARDLLLQLEQLVSVAPPRLRELVLIGHSMGGLVARGACELAALEGQAWLHCARLVVCLGTPHQGAMLEQLGNLTSLALGANEVTRPLARVANARSRGIKDLRHGLRAKGSRKTPAPPPRLALRLIAARLGDESDSVMGSLIGKALGDGLVLPASASDDGLVGDVQRIELAGLGHMALLNHPRVYGHMRQWLAEATLR
jgi:pimeloyl-ACP methyl ester carboxylesterase